MRILMAEDDITSHRVLEAVLKKWGHEVVTTRDGKAAWDALHSEQAPKLAILDWMMPEIDGIDLVKKIREDSAIGSIYIILLTAKGRQEDIIAGLDMGADDYVTKPFDREELRARVNVGTRVMELQDALEQRVRELQDALDQIKRLTGLIPMCASCKKIRDDSGFWNQVEQYIMEHTEAVFSHGLCPECIEKLYPEYSRIKSRKSEPS